jgi:nitroreductase
MELPVKNAKHLLLLDRLYIKLRQSLALLGLPFEAAYDCAIFIFYCRLSPFVPKHKKDSYDLIFFSHTIEKGLSLPEPRPLFGRNNICRILSLLRHCQPDKVNPVALQMALGSLKSYLEFHSNLKIANLFLNDLADELNDLAQQYRITADGGVKNVSNIFQRIDQRLFSYEDFLASRYSCRFFCQKPVPLELIRNVIRNAQQSPSQCNRQSTRVHLHRDKEQIAKLLALQGGGRGFAASVPNLLIITNEVSSWTNRGERNQCYVDAGLFAMGLLFALHANGVGACAMNFSKTNLEERRFRKAANIPAGERVVMLIAVGFQDDKATIAARSARSAVDGVLKIHSP